MSKFENRYPLNVPGKYYIDSDCTDCDLCRFHAPANIRRDERTGISYVFKQPATPKETEAVELGVGGCPTEAVGNDGDQFNWDTTPIYDWNALYKKHPDIHFEIHAPLLRKIGETGPRRPWWRFWLVK